MSPRAGNCSLLLMVVIVFAGCSGGGGSDNGAAGPGSSATYTLSYSAGEGGSLEGNTPQTVTRGADGSVVTAVPNSEYLFAGWSDGNPSATRIDRNVQSNLTTTAQFRKQTPWYTKGHQGDLQVRVMGPRKAILNWPTVPGENYELIITPDPETEIENYTAFGANMVVDAIPPFELSDLNTGEPVYLALLTDGVLTGWTSFKPLTLGTNGAVNAIAVDADGTRYVGGAFTQVGLNTGNGIALPVAGSQAHHPLAWPEVNGSISAVIPDGQGGWYIGGGFTEVDGVPRNCLAQINSSGSVTGWNPGVDGSVLTLAMYDGVIYAGGWFKNAGDQPRERLAAFDSQGYLLDWNPGASGNASYLVVNALVIDQGVIYAGGTFTVAGGEPRGRLAAFSLQGELLDWSPSAGLYSSDAVYTLAIKDNVVYVGGAFDHAGGESRSNLVAFDTQGQLLDWDPNVDDAVDTLLVHDNVIYVGGRFNIVDGFYRESLAAFDSSGQLMAWSPGADGGITTLVADSNVIYAGGQFRSISGEPRAGLAAFDSQGQLLGWNPGAGDTISTIASNNGVVIVGGFSTIGGGEPRQHLVALDSEGHLFDWDAGTSGDVNALLLDGNVIYAGGYFNTANGVSRSSLAAFDNQGQLLNWNPGVSGNFKTVYAFAIDNNIIYAGGSFTAVGGEERNSLAAFDAAGQLLDWNPGIISAYGVYALAIDNNVIYAGGEFPDINLVAFDTQGQAVNWNVGVQSDIGIEEVNSLAVDNGIVYVGGNFDKANYVEPRKCLAAFDTQGQLLNWSPVVDGDFSDVRAIAIHSGTIYIGGYLNGQVSGLLRRGLAAFNTQGQILNWNPDVSSLGSVNAVVVQNNLIYSGGYFSSAGSRFRSNLAVFDINGDVVDR